MNICDVVECELEAEVGRSLCQKHLRRFIDGLVYEEGDLLYDHCMKGHILIAENIRWEGGAKGKKRRRCIQCLRIKAKRQAKNKIDVVEPPAPYRPADVSLSNAIDDFEEAKRHLASKCYDSPEEYMDWDEPPTPEKARELCAGCPLAQACGNYAIAAQEWHGVWGGFVIHEGKRLV